MPDMSDLERIEANASAYSEASDLLRLEELVLAAMSPREHECRTHVMAQMGRVEALRRVTDTFAHHLLTRAQGEEE